MAYKPSQRKFYCPECQTEMSYAETESFGTTLYEIRCKSTEEHCAYSGINWDVKSLERYEINKIAKVEELLEI